MKSNALKTENPVLTDSKTADSIYLSSIQTSLPAMTGRNITIYAIKKYTRRQGRNCSQSLGHAET